MEDTVLRFSNVEMIASVVYVLGIYILCYMMTNCFTRGLSTTCKRSVEPSDDKIKLLQVNDQELAMPRLLADANKKIDKLSKDVERLKKEANTYNLEQIIIDITLNSNQIKDIQSSIERSNNDFEALNQQVKTMRRRLNYSE